MLARLKPHAPPSPARARRAARPRRGATVVESVLVLSVFLLLLFGIFEYCRFLLVLHVTNNAARDGARYASVRMNTDQYAAVQTDIINFTNLRMGSVKNQIQGYKVAVFAVDQAGLDLTPPVIRPKTKSTASPKVYPDPFNPADPNAVPWNSISFTERVAVTIQGTYKPLLPTFLLMPSSIPINITAIMGGEG
jgi:Flp pilus assembly protein TadG